MCGSLCQSSAGTISASAECQDRHLYCTHIPIDDRRYSTFSSQAHDSHASTKIASTRHLRVALPDSQFRQSISLQHQQLVIGRCLSCTHGTCLMRLLLIYLQEVILDVEATASLVSHVGSIASQVKSLLQTDFLCRVHSADYCTVSISFLLTISNRLCLSATQRRTAKITAVSLTEDQIMNGRADHRMPRHTLKIPRHHWHKLCFAFQHG